MNYHLAAFLLAMFIWIMSCNARASEMPAEVKKALVEARIGESGGLWFTDSPKSKQAVEMHAVVSKWFTENWPDIIKNYKTVVVTQKDRGALLEIAEALTPTEYIAYLNHLLDEVLSENVPESVAESAITGSSLKDGFLAFNYAEPAIQDILRKAQKVLNPNSPLQSLIRDMQAGKLHRMVVMQREMNHQSMPERLEANSQQKSVLNTPISDARLLSKERSPEAKPATASEEPLTSTPWSAIAVLIVAATGLMWLLVKKRK